MSSMFQLGIRGVSSTAKSGFIDAGKMGSTVLSVRKARVVRFVLGRRQATGRSRPMRIQWDFVRRIKVQV